MKFATSSVLFATLANISLGLPSDGILTEEDKQALLDLHNDYRSQTALGNTDSQPPATNMQKMGWNEDLAEESRLYASQCVFQHDSGWFGENLYAAASSVDNLDNIEKILSGVTNWFNEYTDYNYDANSCDGVCGHYTQVVWDNSNELGCGYALCEDSIFGWPYELFLVCRYLQPGNFVGQKPYNKANSPDEIGSECPPPLVHEPATGLCVAEIVDPVPTSSPTGCNGASFELELETDFFGSETSWELIDDEDDSLVLSGSGYASMSTYTIAECIPYSCYTFTIYDSWGDGICCGYYGDGSYTVTVDGEEVVTGGEFGSSEATSFCTDEPEICVDSELLVPYQGSLINCDQIVGGNGCDNSVAATHCPLGCDACDAYGCEDSEAPWSIQGSTYNCAQLATLDPADITFYCSALDIDTTCRYTCAYC